MSIILNDSQKWFSDCLFMHPRDGERQVQHIRRLETTIRTMASLWCHEKQSKQSVVFVDFGEWTVHKNAKRTADELNWHCHREKLVIIPLIFGSGYSDSDTDRWAQPGDTICPLGTAASEVTAVAETAAVGSCPHASLPLQKEIRQKFPDFFAGYWKITR